MLLETRLVSKTMAIASWAAADGYPRTLAWITVDDYDNRPKIFWSYVTAALRRAGIAVPQVMPGPTREAVDHVFLVRLASVLAAQDPPVVMVLDDLHLITEPAILDSLTYVLRNAGPGLHLVVASRVDPLVPLHRYRLTGELAEIRADDLAFSAEESGLLLAHHGVTLSEPALGERPGHRPLAEAFEHMPRDVAWTRPQPLLVLAAIGLSDLAREASLAEQLSPREREVLTHLSGMLSTAEIATEMYLSVNTVKTHLRSIYRKLSAAHRSEAVRRARQLGLI